MMLPGVIFFFTFSCMFIQTWEDSTKSRVCRRQLDRVASEAVGRYRNKEAAVVSKSVLVSSVSNA